MTAYLYDYSEPSLSFVFGKTPLVPFVVHTGSIEKTTLPQVMIKGFNLCEKKNSYFFGSKGLTRDYLPYNSSV